MATSYANPQGTGNRPEVKVYWAGGLGGEQNLVDGVTSGATDFFLSGSSIIIEFWFPSFKVIDEAIWYQQSTATHGTWKWQGSPDRATWTDIGSTFTLGSSATQTLTTLNGNTTAYIFYRLFQTAGSANAGPWVYECEFKIDEAGTTSYLNTLGTGNRTGSITISSSSITLTNASDLVDGTQSDEATWDSTTNSGDWFQFDFGSSYVIQQARLYQSNSDAHGDWKWQGSNNGSSFTDVGSSGTLGFTGGALPSLSVMCDISANTTAYRYWRCLGVSGSRSAGPFLREIEFMIAASPGGGGGGRFMRTVDSGLGGGGLVGAGGLAG